MRPRGEIREALSAAARDLAGRHGPVHWRAIAAHAKVGWDAARSTIKDMVRAGELDRAGTARAEWSRRPVTLYLPATPHQARLPFHNEHPLTAAMAAWVSRG